MATWPGGGGALEAWGGGRLEAGGGRGEAWRRRLGEGAGLARGGVGGATSRLHGP